MRPTKLTPALLDAFRAVLADELAAIAFTEEELVWQANQHLPLAEQITYRTFQRYKAEIMGRETGEEEVEEDVAPAPQSLEEQQADTENTELVRQMYVTLKSALLKQKRALVHGVIEGLPNWRRYSWMLERKFPDFRLKLLPKTDTESHKAGSDEVGTKTDTGKPGTVKTRIGGKPAQKTFEQLTEMERIEAKYAKESCYCTPWKQGSNFYEFYFTPERLREREEEMAEAEAKGYVNPYAHMGYQPATCPEGVDYNDYENGWYTFYTMGKETPRLPIRLWWHRQIRHPYTPTDAEKERIWAKQEWERQHPGEVYTNENGEPENVHVFVPQNSPEQCTHNDPWDGEPRPAPNPDQPTTSGGSIYGFSAMG